MKRFFLLAAAMIFGTMLSAQTQTQQGYVKTKGRMVNGKLVLGKCLQRCYPMRAFLITAMRCMIM